MTGMLAGFEMLSVNRSEGLMHSMLYVLIHVTHVHIIIAFKIAACA